METKWTPGPWIICRSRYGGGAPIIAGQGGDVRVATIREDLVAMEANAALIAAAPALYAELFRALAVIANPQAFEVEQVRADINAALAAARGE